MLQVVIPGRFNGPPGSANGSFACALLAAHVDGDADEANLKRLADPLRAALLRRHAVA